MVYENCFVDDILTEDGKVTGVVTNTLGTVRDHTISSKSQSGNLRAPICGPLIKEWRECMEPAVAAWRQRGRSAHYERSAVQ